MKKSWLGLMAGALFLSGCTDMMYSGGVAPVTNSNTYHGQQMSPPMTGWQQPPMNQNPAQMYPPQTRPVRPVPPEAIYAEQQPVPPYGQPGQYGLQNQEASPYGESVRNDIDDGWEVYPGQTQNGSTAEQGIDGMPQERPAADGAKPLRPNREGEGGQQVNTEDNPVNNVANETNVEPAKPETNNQTNVASAAKPIEKPAPNTSAVSSLLQKANSELGKGNLNGAVAFLEEAHRIDSKNANILYDIANIRFHQKRYRQAEAAAAKAANASGNAGVQRKSWALIANARKALGDNQGAIAASEKAASL